MNRKNRRHHTLQDDEVLGEVWVELNRARNHVRNAYQRPKETERFLSLALDEVEHSQQMIYLTLKTLHQMRLSEEQDVQA